MTTSDTPPPRTSSSKRTTTAPTVEPVEQAVLDAARLKLARWLARTVQQEGLTVELHSTGTLDVPSFEVRLRGCTLVVHVDAGL